MPYLLPIGLIAVVWLAIVVLSERWNLLSCDRFPTPVHKYAAYAWLGAFMLFLAYLVTGSALRPATSSQLAKTPFFTLFALHAILVAFLLGWWLLTGRPRVREYLNIQRQPVHEVALTGIAVGVGGWIFTLLAALAVALILKSVGVLPEQPEPPAMVGWMAALPIWKKALIVMSAMTIEEFFFRSWLQKRVGLIASTTLFALAHFTYGQPLFLIGVSVISLIIGVTFYRTKNVVPGIIAHGVFDAIQLFVIVPLAVRLMGISG